MIRVSLISEKDEGGKITRYLSVHPEADRRNMVWHDEDFVNLNLNLLTPELGSMHLSRASIPAL